MRHPLGGRKISPPRGGKCEVLEKKGRRRVAEKKKRGCQGKKRGRREGKALGKREGPFRRKEGNVGVGNPGKTPQAEPLRRETFFPERRLWCRGGAGRKRLLNIQGEKKLLSCREKGGGGLLIPWGGVKGEQGGGEKSSISSGKRGGRTFPFSKTFKEGGIVSPLWGERGGGVSLPAGRKRPEGDGLKKKTSLYYFHLRGREKRRKEKPHSETGSKAGKKKRQGVGPLRRRRREREKRRLHVLLYDHGKRGHSGEGA